MPCYLGDSTKEYVVKLVIADSTFKLHVYACTYIKEKRGLGFTRSCVKELELNLLLKKKGTFFNMLSLVFDFLVFDGRKW